MNDPAAGINATGSPTSPASHGLRDTPASPGLPATPSSPESQRCRAPDDPATARPFRPHPLVRGGHAQTLAGAYWRSDPFVETARRHRVALADGDQLVLHDDAPRDWRPGGRTVLLAHGLCGSHASGYMRRATAKLVACGARCFRLDLRGCGAGAGLAILPYHSGRSEDAAAALEFIAGACPGSPTTLIGYSLGGAIALKLLGETGEQCCGGLDSAIAVCPPIDLAASCRNIGRRSNRLYDRHFVWRLLRSLAQLRRSRPDAPGIALPRNPRTLEEFDDVYTAPVSGFGSAANYYRQASSKPLLASIRKPTLVIAADDDPLIPPAIFDDLPASDFLRISMVAGGGHLGFIDRGGKNADRRWLDGRIVDWVRALG